MLSSHLDGNIVMRKQSSPHRYYPRTIQILSFLVSSRRGLSTTARPYDKGKRLIVPAQTPEMAKKRIPSFCRSFLVFRGHFEAEVAVTVATCQISQHTPPVLP